MHELQKEALFVELHRVYQQIETLPMLFQMDELMVMNEVGYRVTWLRYHSGREDGVDMDRYVREVYADMGLEDSAEVVFSLVYAVVSIVNRPPLDIEPEAIERLRQLNEESCCSRIVDNFISAISRSGKQFGTRFDPPKEIDEEMSRTTPPHTKSRSHTKSRAFTLDEIVSFAKENLTLDASVAIQTMLYSLLAEDGTKEERAKVASIPKGIQDRQAHPHYIGQMVGTQTILGSSADDLKNLLQNDEVRKLLGNHE